MSENQAFKDYKFPEKHAWRIHTWKSAKKRLSQSGYDVSKCRVLYLAGAGDKDRSLATRIGFNKNNLIIVERDKKAFRLLRESRKPVIGGELIDIVSLIPRSDVHFINADLCSGFSADNLQTIIYSFNALCVGGILSLNMLKGRDPLLSSYKKHDPYVNFDSRPGASLCVALSKMTSFVFMKDENSGTRLLHSIIYESKETTFEYRSGNLVFESSIFTVGETLKALSDKIFYSHNKELKQRKGSKWAAAKAVSTSRNLGKLTHAPAA